MRSKKKVWALLYFLSGRLHLRNNSLLITVFPSNVIWSSYEKNVSVDVSIAKFCYNRQQNSPPVYLSNSRSASCADISLQHMTFHAPKAFIQFRVFWFVITLPIRKKMYKESLRNWLKGANKEPGVKRFLVLRISINSPERWRNCIAILGRNAKSKETHGPKNVLVLVKMSPFERWMLRGISMLSIWLASYLLDCCWFIKLLSFQKGFLSKFGFEASKTLISWAMPELTEKSFLRAHVFSHVLSVSRILEPKNFLNHIQSIAVY